MAVHGIEINLCSASRSPSVTAAPCMPFRSLEAGTWCLHNLQVPRKGAQNPHLARLRHDGDVQCALWRREHALARPAETLGAPSARILLQAWPLHIDSKLLRACTRALISQCLSEVILPHHSAKLNMY